MNFIDQIFMATAINIWLSVVYRVVVIVACLKFIFGG